MASTLLLAVLGLALAAAPAREAIAAPKAEPTAQQQMAEGYEAWQAGDCAKATPLVRRAAERGVADNLESVAFAILGVCAVEGSRFDEAYVSLARATARRGAPDVFWHLRLQSAAWAERPLDVATTLEQMADQAPAALAAIEDDVIDEAWRSLAKADAVDRRRFFAVLDSSGYKPRSALRRLDWAWAEYAALLIDAGEAREAERLARRVENTDQLISMRLDGRFATVVAANPARFDIQTAAERDLARSRALHGSHPDELRAVIDHANSLRSLGRDAEALTILQAAGARLDRGKPFKDVDDYRNWLLNETAYTLQSLGRTDEAVAAMARAAGGKEMGAPNVSQTINLASLLNSVGRPREALAALAPLLKDNKGASAFGQMFVASEQVCAHAQLQDQAAMAAPLAFTAAHAADNPGARSRALLCAGDLDGAAASYIARLADEDERRQALLALSHPAPEPHPGAFTLVLQERLEQVRARADVQAAVARVGRTERLPIRSVYWGDI